MKNNKLMKMIAIGAVVISIGATTAFAAQELITDLSKDATVGESTQGIVDTDLFMSDNIDLNDTECVDLSSDMTVNKTKPGNGKIDSNIDMETTDGVVLPDNETIDISKDATIGNTVSGSTVNTEDDNSVNGFVINK